MDRLKRILFDLIRIPSESNNLKALEEVIEYVEEIFKDKSIYVEKVRVNGKPSIFLAFEKNYNPEILFAGHLDVVPADYEYQFNPTLENGRVYGRGAFDMKGSCASMITLFLELMERNIRKDVSFLFTTDEEVGSKDGVEFWVKEKNLIPKFAIIPDGGFDFKIINEGKGVLHVKFKAKGRSAHGSTPWEGENAAEKLIDLYRDYKIWVDSFKGEEEEPNWKITVSLGKISSGKAVNIVPSEGEMELDFRFPPPWRLREFEEKIREFLKDKEGIVMEVKSSGETFYTPRDNPYLMKFSEAVKKVKKRVEFGRIYGATDGRFFAERGVPVVLIYGVGGGIHGSDEWVDLKSLYELKEVFFNFLESL
ncbi:MAG: M20/M25/M40 family metallo-hydrolase [Candidatus Hydrothermales bacterium]